MTKVEQLLEEMRRERRAGDPRLTDDDKAILRRIRLRRKAMLGLKRSLVNTGRFNVLQDHLSARISTGYLCIKCARYERVGKLLAACR